ncbi:MAG: cyclopropane fatty acyl phospholipid synthase [Gammaproteobacteria bacterium]
MKSVRDRLQQLLAAADVRLDGVRRWDIRVLEPVFAARVLAHGSLGLGESYMDGDWECADLDGMLTRVLAARLDERVRTLDDLWFALRARLGNRAKRRAFEIGRRHYDLGNDLYRAMLGKRLVYSCAYWPEARDLDQAQEHKLDLCCRKLGLAPGMSLLDIGCGWGEALRFAAERYGVSGAGDTVSAQQAELARELCRGWPIEIRLQDFRERAGTFDRVLSIGMFEHVGAKNHRRFFEVARACMPEDGLLLLHTIGNEHTVHSTDPWIGRHIFPNSVLPSAVQITRAIEGLFVIEDWHCFGADYDRTLGAWRDNVERAWPALGDRYDGRFQRMWRYYLAASMATFRACRSQLWQLVLSPRGVRGGYRAPR